MHKVNIIEVKCIIGHRWFTPNVPPCSKWLFMLHIDLYSCIKQQSILWLHNSTSHHLGMERKPIFSATLPISEERPPELPPGRDNTALKYASSNICATNISLCLRVVNVFRSLASWHELTLHRFSMMVEWIGWVMMYGGVIWGIPTSTQLPKLGVGVYTLSFSGCLQGTLTGLEEEK